MFATYSNSPNTATKQQQNRRKDAVGLDPEAVDVPKLEVEPAVVVEVASRDLALVLALDDPARVGKTETVPSLKRNQNRGLQRPKRRKEDRTLAAVREVRVIGPAVKAKAKVKVGLAVGLEEKARVRVRAEVVLAVEAGVKVRVRVRVKVKADLAATVALRAEVEAGVAVRAPEKSIEVTAEVVRAKEIGIGLEVVREKDLAIALRSLRRTKIRKRIKRVLAGILHAREGIEVEVALEAEAVIGIAKEGEGVNLRNAREAGVGVSLDTVLPSAKEMTNRREMEVIPDWLL